MNSNQITTTAATTTPALTNILSTHNHNLRPLNLKSFSVDYGFECLNSQSPSIVASSTTTNSNHQIKHSTLNSNLTSSSASSSSSSASNSNSGAMANSTDLLLLYNENLRYIQKNEYELYSKILDRLSKSSMERPAHVPLLCVTTFSLNDSKWLKFCQRLSSLGINVRLIEIVKGVPVNALFYLSNLDLIYVRTADDLEGYLPKDCCKPIICCKIINQNDYISEQVGCESAIKTSENSSVEFNFIPIQENVNGDMTERDSIKYHSLSSSEYDELNEQHAQNQEHESKEDYTLYKTRDSGYKSELESNNANTRLSLYGKQQMNPPVTETNDYFSLTEQNYDTNKKLSPQKYLISTQSRSRLPISVSSNLNLTLVNPGVKQYEGFTNKTYVNQSPKIGTPKLENRKSSEFQRAKNSRRSLDSSLTQSHHFLTAYNNNTNNNSQNNKFFAVPIDLTEDKKTFQDLDLRKIELDSLSDYNTINTEIESGAKLWTVILRHEARNFQEISVLPGMLIHIIKQFNDWIYVKLIGYEKSNLEVAQQYGIIPRSCVADLNEKVYSQLNQNNNNSSLSSDYWNYQNSINNKSSFKPQQITAL
jgi:hypothetical protein